jgi:serine/threonine protein kinase
MLEQSLFIEALEKDDPAERAAFLDRACANDPALRRRIERLLERHWQTDSFLETPAAVVVATVEEPITERPGTVIGPYKLLEQIGEGGFGVVFLAEQQHPVRRKVALKVLKPGMDTRQVIARFEAERQALALMDHPNIARVLDGGETARGRPYFVMELVKGIPITDFCDQDQQTPQQRLELFVSVCQAVQHAHQKGIIHRDLKPSNILVTLHDGTPSPCPLPRGGGEGRVRGVVKVIDFGIAKATGQQLTDKTLFTNFAQLIGTPLYMSPEQAALGSLDVDTRSDVYALGVLLYELLTGTTPFDRERFREAGYDEMRRIIREEEPPRPSTRLRKEEGGRRKDEFRTGRRPGLSRFLSFSSFILHPSSLQELDWIVMKCLEKDRNRRYDSANGLALDIQRYLHDEPVLACPPSAWYRARKFAWRNKGTLTTTALLIAALVLTTVVLAISNVSVTRERNEKDQALKEKGVALGQARANEEAARASSELGRKIVDDIYEQVAYKLDAQPQLELLQQEFFQKVLTFYREFARQNNRDPEVRLGLANAYYRFGVMTLQRHMRHHEAEEMYTLAVAVLEQLVADYPAEPRYRTKLAQAYWALGSVRVETQGASQAEEAYRSALRLRRQLAVEAPQEPQYRWALVTSHIYLGKLLYARPEEAEAEIRAAIMLCEQLVIEFPEQPRYRGDLVQGHHALGLLYLATNRPLEAERCFHEAIALYQPAAAALNTTFYRIFLFCAYHGLARAVHANGRLREAENVYRQAIALFEKEVATSVDRPEYWQGLFLCYANLARLLEESSRVEETAPLCRQAMDLYAKVIAALPDEVGRQPLVTRVAWLLTIVLKNSGRPAEIEKGYRQALAPAEKGAAQFPTHAGYRFLMAYWYNALGSLLTTAGRASEAADAYREAAAQYRGALERNPKQVPSLNAWAWLLATCPPEMGLRDAGQAISLAKQAVELEPRAGYIWNTLGVAHYRAGDWSAAVTALEKSLELDAGIPEWWAQRASYSTFFLAMAHMRLGKPEAARQWYDRAVRWMDNYQPKDDELRRFRTEAAALLGIEETNN